MFLVLKSVSEIYFPQKKKHTTYDHSGFMFNHVGTFMAWLEDLPFFKETLLGVGPALEVLLCCTVRQ